MPKLNILDRKGKKVGTYNVEPTDFAPRISKQLLHDAVVMYQANERQGSHQTKSRGMVAGSTKKMYRQKGTGNARAGSKRSGIRRGGGHIFAKVNRDYGYRLPRKALQTATRMALAAKVRDEELVIIDELSFVEPKTKDMVVGHQARGLRRRHRCWWRRPVTTRRSIAAPGILPGVAISPAGEINAYSVLRSRRVLVTKAALDALVASAKSQRRRRARTATRREAGPHEARHDQDGSRPAEAAKKKAAE